MFNRRDRLARQPNPTPLGPTCRHLRHRLGPANLPIVRGARGPREIASLANSLIRREATIVVGAASSRGRGDLIVVPAPFGSLGDDLLVRGVASLNGRDSRAASWRLNERWPIATDPLGGALLRQSRRHLVARTFLRRRATARWGRVIYIGADTLDGAYGLSVMAGLDMVDHCATQGGAASVVGFSFSDSPRVEVVERVRRMSPAVRFVARGSISAARFRSATGTPCAVAPDPSWGYLAAKELPLHHRLSQKPAEPANPSASRGDQPRGAGHPTIRRRAIRERRFAASYRRWEATASNLWPCLMTSAAASPMRRCCAL